MLSPWSREPRREVRDIASREVVPVSEWPNFRDHGRMVDTPLLNLLSKLQQKHGRAWASEGGLRKMICEDTRHMPGPTTIPKALKRMGVQGLVVNVQLFPGDIKPDGELCTHGTRLVWVPRTDKQRRAARAYNARPGRAPYRSPRHTGFDARALVAKIGGAERPSMPASPMETYRARRDEQVAKLRALEALWSADDKAKRDKGPGPPE